ncbi:hypothetical protein EZV62_008202 [Acer yangbiense]|uniref:Uncharacterized protein n=1 Tax=Acer yangbiense TaxID=1000413 RepID=A0A5C7ICH9_9ROSI|nr:hypothetical protein EZV62_008202 [Acer yangbiense]
MLIASVDLEKINDLKKQFSREFEMKDLGATNQILGIWISKDEHMGRHGAGFWGGYDHASSVRYGGGGVGLLHCLGRLAWATAVIDLGRRNLTVSRLAWGPEWKGKP